MNENVCFTYLQCYGLGKKTFVHTYFTYVSISSINYIYEKCPLNDKKVIPLSKGSNQNCMHDNFEHV